MAYHPFRDFWLKGVAVTIAVLLWLTVAGEPVVERGLEVPLEFENMPANIGIAGDLPDSVSVRVRGSARVVRRLVEEEIVAVLDLGGERPGRRLFDMFAGRVEVPSGIEVTSVVPATLTLTLERHGVPRTVPIVPDIEGQPAAGLTVGRITTDPPSVAVSGPETALADLREALTEPVSIAGVTRNVETEVTVGIADPTLRLVEPVSARVLVELVPAPVERTLLDVPIEHDSERSVRVVLEPPQVTVGVRGPRDSMREVEATMVRASVDVTGLAAGRYTLPVAVESAGDDVRITHIDPPAVQVSVR